MILLGALLGAVAGLGVLRLVRGQPLQLPGGGSRTSVHVGLEEAVGLACGLALGVLTGWPVLGVAGGFLAAELLRGTREAVADKQAIARRRALAQVAARLQTLFGAGHGLAEAVAVTAATGPEELRAELKQLGDGIRAKGVERAFSDYASAATDPLFAVFASTVGTASRLGSQDLGRQLGQFADAAFKGANTARELSAQQGSHRLSASVVAGLSVGILLWLRIQSPAYVQAYDDVAGQLAMAVGFVPIGIGYAAMLRVGRRQRRLGWLRGASDGAGAEKTERKGAKTWARV